MVRTEPRNGIVKPGFSATATNGIWLKRIHHFRVNYVCPERVGRESTFAGPGRVKRPSLRFRPMPSML